MKLTEYPTTVLNDRIRHFRGGAKRTLAPSTYFQWSQDPLNPQDLPWMEQPCTFS